ncbi:hypothetical protein CCY97_03230 [Helicobacter sp. 10-6591]|nr:hypothetical protein CCY97_03230 [Helicobacter sp. 10-6591]
MEYIFKQCVSYKGMKKANDAWKGDKSIFDLNFFVLGIKILLKQRVFRVSAPPFKLDKLHLPFKDS